MVPATGIEPARP